MRYRLLAVVVALIVLGVGAGFLAHFIRTGAVGKGTASATDGQILAKVNGTPITLGQLALADEEMGPALTQVPENLRYQYLLSMLIDRRIMELEAKKQGLQSDPQTKQRQAYYDEKALRDVYWIHAMNKKITPAMIQTYYDTNIGSAAPEQEIHAEHILVNTKDEAQAALDSIKNGKSFEDVAKAVSKDDSASHGGDLGWFKKGDMIAEFSNAAFKLKPGEMSGPVQSKFGWHVIKVLEAREAPAKTLEQAQPEIAQELSTQEGRKLIEDMRKTAKIEITGAADAKAVAPAPAR